jgi:hypothetical protein
MDATDALAKEVRELRTLIAGLQPGLAAHPHAPDPRAAHPTGGGHPLFYFVVYFIVPVLLLLAAHYLLVMRLDARPIWLRIVSILLPMPFGAALQIKERHGFWAALVMGSMVGAAAVAGMLAVVGVIDVRPIVPADRREWQESIEFAVSITLAMVTGNLIGRMIARYTGAGARGQAGAPGGAAGAEQSSQSDRLFRMDMVITAIGAIAAAVGSLISGLKGE